MTSSRIAFSSVDLLIKNELLTANVVATARGIGYRSAANLLLRWEKDGLLRRTAPGCYVSAFVKDENRSLHFESLQSSVGHELLLVGPSSWEHYGLCERGPLHVAIPTQPSRTLAKFPNTVVYSLGKIGYKHILKYAEINDENKPSILNPVSQMLWWMSGECPVEMPSPDEVNWVKANEYRDLKSAILKSIGDPKDSTNLNFELESVYRLIYLDWVNDNEVQSENTKWNGLNEPNVVR